MLIRADARSLPLRDECVQCVVTSPPYWGLRDYGLEPSVWGGDPECEHAFVLEQFETEVGGGNWSQAVNGRGEPQAGGLQGKRKPIQAVAERGFCECGAWLGALGLEPTPELYVEHMAQIFDEVRRVLRPDGTLWLNIGDSYAGSAGGYQGKNGQRASRTFTARISIDKRGLGLKPKDLVGIPWMLAFALRDAGWYLRSDIIWSKSNPMPESVQDRPTRSHESLFLLAKSERYWYDADAVREAHKPSSEARYQCKPSVQRVVNLKGLRRADGSRPFKPGRNMRSVWQFPTQPYAGAHFATFPEQLARRCILAGCPVGGVVLDPFVGSGTTVRVARDLGRKGIGVDLSRDYLHEQARYRIRTTQGLGL